MGESVSLEAAELPAQQLLAVKTHVRPLSTGAGAALQPPAQPSPPTPHLVVCAVGAGHELAVGAGGGEPGLQVVPAGQGRQVSTGQLRQVSTLLY